MADERSSRKDEVDAITGAPCQLSQCAIENRSTVGVGVCYENASRRLPPPPPSTLQSTEINRDKIP